MTAAYRLKGLGWFGGVVLVSLGFYLVSLQVAAERKKLAQVETKISAAERDIRALETEFNVRANLAQLERWNGDTLALVAPTAQQFVRDEGQLASISFTRGMPSATDGVRTAALIVPSGVSDPVPVVVDAVPVAVASAATAAATGSVVKVAARPATPRPASARASQPIVEAARPVAVASVSQDVPAARKARAVAMLDRSLLSDSTLGDLMTGARSETRRLR